MKPYSTLYDAKPALHKILDTMNEQQAEEFLEHLSCDRLSMYYDDMDRADYR